MAVTFTEPTALEGTPGTYRAAVVREFHAPLTVEQVQRPRLEAGQVLVKVEASGLCHTDIHAAHGDWPVKPNPPFIPGHEGVGVVERTGPGASLHQPGDRVAIAWLASACEGCAYCISGWETLCERQQNSGYSVDGAYAEYAVADDRYVVDVPEGVTSFDAAPLTCAGVTTFKAFKVSQLQPGETAVVYGVGGLGHLALQYARLFGGIVIAVDIEDSKLELAKTLGADHVVNARKTDPVQAVQALGGADVAVSLAASPRSFEQAFGSLRRGGRLVCVALPADDNMTIPIFDTVLSGKSIIGSIVGTRKDLADVFALHAAGRTKVIAEARKLDEVYACFDDVLASRVPARLVFTF
jgi:alcohol dehydrogenase, propanol-preferring